MTESKAAWIKTETQSYTTQDTDKKITWVGLGQIVTRIRTQAMKLFGSGLRH